MNWTDAIPVCPSTGIGLAVNERYTEDGNSSEEHDYEDCSFRLHYENDHYLYGVFDGHDGKRASEFASQRFPAELLLEQKVKKDMTSSEVFSALIDAFNAVERGFFESIADFLTERIQVLQSLPKTMNSYELLQKFPEKLERLQELEELINGGTAAVVALIHANKLYVANVGNARALLCYRSEGSDLQVRQLTSDHIISDKNEATRLQRLGIDINRVISCGGLGSHDNTRTVGDYCLKGGYKENSVLRVASVEPIIAEPEIHGLTIDDSSWYFLILMSSGFYKALEMYSCVQDTNKHIANIVLNELKSSTDINSATQNVVDRICKEHRRSFLKDRRSNCSCHDDMTLLIRSFFPNDTRRGSMPTQSPLSQSYVYKSNPFVSSTPDSQRDRASSIPNATVSSNSLQYVDSKKNDLAQSQPYSYQTRRNLQLSDGQCVSDLMLFPNESSRQPMTSSPTNEFEERKEFNPLSNIQKPFLNVSSDQPKLTHSVSTPQHASLLTDDTSSRWAIPVNPVSPDNSHTATPQVDSAPAAGITQETKKSNSFSNLPPLIDFNADNNDIFGQLVTSEFPYTEPVRTEPVHIPNTDTYPDGRDENRTLSSEKFDSSANASSNSESTIVSITKKHKEVSSTSIDKSFDDGVKSPTSHWRSDIQNTSTDTVSNLQIPPLDNSSTLDDIVSKNSDYANSYVDFGPLEALLRKHGVEIDELGS